MTQIPNYTKITYKTKPRPLVFTTKEIETAQFDPERRRKRLFSLVQMFNGEAKRQGRMAQDTFSTWGNVRDNLSIPFSSRRHSEGYAMISRRDYILSDGNGASGFGGEKRFSQPREHSETFANRRTSVVGGLLGTAAFKRQVLRKPVNLKRRRQLYMKFKMLGRLTILLHRMCRLHFQELQDDEEDSNAMTFAQIAFHGKRDPSVDLMFDVSKFKANKEYRISSDAKTVMKTHPNERTEEDIHVIQRTLLDLKSFAEYPVKMQLKVAKVGWFQTFNPKRVIIREGHPPQSFYFLLSGSVLITSSNASSTTNSKSISVLKRGSSFGDLAILQNTKRSFTATASEKVELFCISKKDFIRIFMAGGEKKLQDPELGEFIRNLEILKNWPIQLLEEHPEKCMFNYFKRGTLLIENSNTSDKIFIVKSGSCTVLKKLRCTTPATTVKESGRDDEVTGTDGEREIELTHRQLIEQKERKFLRRKMKTIKKMNMSIYERGLNLPLLHTKDIGGGGVRDRSGSILSTISERESVMSHDYILRDDFIDESFSGHSSRGYSTSPDDLRRINPYISRVSSSSNDFDKGNSVDKSISEQSQTFYTERQHPHTCREKKTVESWLSKLPSEHRIFSENKYKIDEDKNSLSTRRQPEPPHINVIPDQDIKAPLPPLSSDLKDHSNSATSVWSKVSKTSKAKNRFVFVEVQKLQKGGIFGLTNDLFGNQPNLSLVSDGAECLVLSKQFFLDNASDFQIHTIRIAGVPYPTDQEMQVNLERHEAWKTYRDKTLKEVIDDVTSKKRKKNTHLLPVF
ncbi:uncharacterized protein LOC117100910 [Anneissia japonica]|uniref:uncharacterized protein LOC117100910 n=1 Tax=Anneissia japonica TaxID=1529436 RepID=UPI001425540B|nr:uncharacterized protein LOC117100910 [Anneissia japonica]